MGTPHDHEKKAQRNQAFLATIDQKTFPDWTVTVAFYRALHLIEKSFAEHNHHSDNHRSRHDLLKRQYADLWMQYSPLYSQSRRARYQNRPISPQTVSYVLGRLGNVEAMTSKPIAPPRPL